MTLRRIKTETLKHSASCYSTRMNCKVCVSVCVLTVGKALCDGGSGIRVGATLPLDVPFLNGPQETMVTLIRYTWTHQSTRRHFQDF